MNFTNIAELSITDTSPQGFGLGQIGSRTVEVAHAIPGDRVRVGISRAGRRVRKGRLLALLEPSLERIEAPCRHAQLCGGCPWQAMHYEAQLHHKQKILQRLFQGILEGVEQLPMIPCATQWHYRNKMEFSFSENRAKTRFLGLMIAHAGPYVFNVEQCEIAPHWMSSALQKIRSWWEQSGLEAYQPSREVGVLRYITMREGMRTQDKMLILNVTQNLPEEALRSFVEAMDMEASLFLRIHASQRGVPTSFQEVHLRGKHYFMEELHLSSQRLQFAVSPSSFFQPNTYQAEKLYNAALSMLGRPNLVFDLYAGTGTLSIAAASVAERVISIELNPDAVKDARENSARNGLQNLEMYVGDVGKVLPTIDEKPDAVILDPPRAGLEPKALRTLIALAPDTILYISCNPRTQAENIVELLRAGYRLEKVQAVDQFPHTAHIEHIALLKRKASRILSNLEVEK